MAWRPWYQPQLPHTTWGSLAEPQRGHTERAGTLSVHADARWLRVLLFDFFFFGTGMAVPWRVAMVSGAHTPGTNRRC